MKELTTTLNKMRDCLDYWVRTSEWEGLLMHLGKTEADDEPLLLQAILGSSHGTSGAIWALITIEGYDNAIRLYACYCAKVAAREQGERQ